MVKIKSLYGLLALACAADSAGLLTGKSGAGFGSCVVRYGCFYCSGACHNIKDRSMLFAF